MKVGSFLLRGACTQSCHALWSAQALPWLHALVVMCSVAVSEASTSTKTGTALEVGKSLPSHTHIIPNAFSAFRSYQPHSNGRVLKCR